MFHGELFDCTTGALIEQQMETQRSFGGGKSNELRDFILYRYYLSQYPELFSSLNTTNAEDGDSALPSSGRHCKGEEDSMSGALVATHSQPYNSRLTDTATTLPETELPFFYLSSTEEEERLASKFLELSLKGHNRAAAKLCKRSNTDTSDKRCCLLCNCANRNASDSSLWSLSEPDLSQMTIKPEVVHQDSSRAHIFQGNQTSSANNNSNTLTVNGRGTEERYSHLCRVITPPNAFLNSSANMSMNEQQLTSGASADFDDCLCAPVAPKTISYSNKVTQTDGEFGRTKANYKMTNNNKQQRFNSVSEKGHLYSSHTKAAVPTTVASISGRSVDSDHIYHTIMEESLLQAANTPSVKLDKIGNVKQRSKREKEKSSSSSLIARSLKLEELKQKQIELIKNSSFRGSPINKVHDCRTGSLPPTLMSSSSSGNGFIFPGIFGPPPQLEEEEHRIATSKDGIPCTCNRCRDSRGK